MRAIILSLFLILLTGCSVQDNESYFSEDSAEENATEQSWFSEQFNKFSDWLGDKIDNFDPTEEAESLPPSVYDYDVEKDFPLEEDNTEEKKSLKEYWKGMWKEKETEE